MLPVMKGYGKKRSRPAMQAINTGALRTSVASACRFCSATAAASSACAASSFRLAAASALRARSIARFASC